MDGKTCFIVAEAGVNHNGSLEEALRLVDAARDAGADAIKFQTFRAGSLVSRYAPKADYQKETTDPGESQLEMIRKLELDQEAHIRLMAQCQALGIAFLSSPFDLESLAFLSTRTEVKALKIPSGEITNGPLLLAAGRSGKEIILSTGMATMGEVEKALAVLAFGMMGGEGTPNSELFDAAYDSPRGGDLLRARITLLQCTTEYPAPYGEVNLLGMDTLSCAFGLRTGLSDHTPGIAVALAAVARGAALVEKHFTRDRSQPGPDHRASLEPAELKSMTRSIRQVEEALGDGRKIPSNSEWKNRPVARKSLVALERIERGTPFTTANLGVKRPGVGRSPMEYWTCLGTLAEQDYQPDQVIR
ncbi:MAG: N-acetylneuraminate synthase [Magnetococcales bacterium]|nr:N-acetylneuraminate synthase [Magnetococcales bacterium]